MLEYFFNQTSLKEIIKIKELLNLKKLRLKSLDFTNPFKEYREAEPLFNRVKSTAIKLQNEKLANATFIVKRYFYLFCNISNYFSLLKNKKYEKSWEELQDCLDDIYLIERFVEIHKESELSFVKHLLKECERLYPYKLFLSPEYIVLESECSICGKPMNSILCDHMKGDIYWGEIAYEKIKRLKFNAIAIVNNPKDKRRVILPRYEGVDEIEYFSALDDFINQNFNNFQSFKTENNKNIKKT